MLSALLDAYRRTGADPPFADPGRAHGVAMEGYYWRFVDRAAGRVVVALCGACRTPGREPWALVALAAHPGGHVRHAVVAAPEPARERFGVVAGEALAGDGERLSVRLGNDALELRFPRAVAWPRRSLGALGLAHALPGLPQYWHPVVLGGRADGELRLGGERLALCGATPYAEKNWGGAFARSWWWGHAAAFDDPRVAVAFAGGRVRLGPVPVAPSAVALRLGDRVAALAPPAALVRAGGDERGWRLRARSPGWQVEVEIEALGEPHRLPVPDVATGTVEPLARQHLAARLRLAVRRRGRLAFAGESPLAGLERGAPAG